MPKVITAYNARTHFGRVLSLLRKGERFVITKKGVPIGVLLNEDDAEKLLDQHAGEFFSPKIRRDIESAKKAIRTGRGLHSIEQLKALYGKK